MQKELDDEDDEGVHAQVISSSSRPSRRSGLDGQHEQHAPLWVVRVAHVLEMTGKLQVHQALEDTRSLGELDAQDVHPFCFSPVARLSPPRRERRATACALKNLMAKQLKIEKDFPFTIL